MFRVRCAVCHSKYRRQSNKMTIPRLVKSLFHRKMTFHCGNPDCWSYICTNCMEKCIPHIRDGATPNLDKTLLHFQTMRDWIYRFGGPYRCPVCGTKEVHATNECSALIEKGVHQKSGKLQRKPSYAEAKTQTPDEKLIEAKQEKFQEAKIIYEKDYLRYCMEPKYDEQEESRSWDSDPAFRKVLDPLNSGDYSRACTEAASLVAQFSDFADLYYWWGKALLGIQEFDKALSILTDALGKTKRKYPICNLLGEIEWKEAGDIAEAVYWWSQGMHCQESLSNQNFGGDVGAYLYLYYIADALVLSDCASAFVMRVDQIRPGKIRLNSENANALSSLTRTANNKRISEVLRQLVSTYIVPKKTTANVDPNEVDRLIRQLEERDSLGWSSERNVEAAKRLGELGDPRAIGPLTRAMRNISLSLQVAAEEAIKKIKEANQNKT